MRRKPRGAKYRNLTARAGVIYYERQVDGRRIRLSTKTADWDEAAAFRDLYEEKKRIGCALPFLEVPRFGEFAQRYLHSATSHLSACSLSDRTLALREGGVLARYFGDMRLDDLTRPVLLEWWHAEIEGRGRSHGTGMVRLAMLSGVLGYAVDLELIPENAVDALRATLRRRRQSKRGRAEAAAGAHVRPIGEPAELQAFVTASEAAHRMRFQNGVPKLQRRDGHVADLLQLDAGLRLGEVEGLRWGHIIWGDGPDDASRAIVISEAVARGKYQGPPKSGRSRRVGLSRRLRKLLREYWVVKGQPAAGERVLERFNPQNYATRHFSEVCGAAKLEQRHTPKDLRDTFASQLLTAGVQLGYVSEQLGHSDVAVTAKHYAKWAGGSQYRQPLTVGAGELPADLIARIPEESPQKSPQLAEKHSS